MPRPATSNPRPTHPPQRSRSQRYPKASGSRASFTILREYTPDPNRQLRALLLLLRPALHVAPHVNYYRASAPKGAA